MSSLSEYTIRLSRYPFMGTWTYKITTPDGRTLLPLGMHMTRASAEVSALRQVEMDQETYILNGEELRNKVRSTSE